MEKVRFGVIGCANVAWKSFLPALKKSRCAELIAVASRSAEKAKKFAAAFDCIPVYGYENLLMRHDIDAVYIATPTGLHAKWAIAGARAGKHLLCEKTLATTIAETRSIMDACKKTNVALLEGFAYQFHPQHAMVRDLVAQGRIGEPIVFQAWFGFPPINSEHRYHPELGGGALLDAGTYTVHAARQFFSRMPTRVYGRLDQKDYAVDIHGTVLLDFGRGQTASLSFGFNNMYRNAYAVWGTQGLVTAARAFSIPPHYSPTITLEQQDYQECHQLIPNDQFLIEIETFCAGLKEVTQWALWRQDALEHARLLEAIRQSSSNDSSIRPFPT